MSIKSRVYRLGYCSIITVPREIIIKRNIKIGDYILWDLKRVVRNKNIK